MCEEVSVKQSFFIFFPSMYVNCIEIMWVRFRNVIIKLSLVIPSKKYIVSYRGIICEILYAKSVKTLKQYFKNNPTSACSGVCEILLDVFKFLCVSFLWPKEGLFFSRSAMFVILLDYAPLPFDFSTAGFGICGLLFLLCHLRHLGWSLRQNICSLRLMSCIRNFPSPLIVRSTVSSFTWNTSNKLNLYTK